MFLVVGLVSGCSTARHRDNSPELRVMVDAESVDAISRMQIQSFLLKSGRFYVVDRAEGLSAAVKEQNMLHRDHAERFSPEEKYALWAKLYGVGGVVVAKSSCTKLAGWMAYTYYLHCVQILTLVDATTGEILASEVHEADGEYHVFNSPPSWADAVEKFVDAVPKTYREPEYSGRLVAHRKLASEIKVKKTEIDE